MRLAVVIRGISYYDGEEMIGNSKSIDYRVCLQSFRDNILDGLKGIFDEIDFFLVTYYNDLEIFKQLLDEYQPKDVIIYPRKNTTIKHSDGNKYVGWLVAQSLELVASYHYNHVLQTRFDLFYYQKLDPSKIKLDKINFGWKGQIGQCDDAFMLIPDKFIYPLIQVYKKEICTHNINKDDGISQHCHYLSRDLDPANGYHYPDFFIFQRVVEDYKSGKLKVYQV
jgi:hypothetical protein